MAEAIMLKTPPDAAEQVAALSRRMAHAVYALVVATTEYRLANISEIVLYDREAASTRVTAMNLSGAREHGLATYVGRGLWAPTIIASLLHDALEDRFLADTEGETK